MQSTQQSIRKPPDLSGERGRRQEERHGREKDALGMAPGSGRKNTLVFRSQACSRTSKDLGYVEK